MTKLSANISACWNSRSQHSGLYARLPLPDGNQPEALHVRVQQADTGESGRDRDGLHSVGISKPERGGSDDYLLQDGDRDPFDRSTEQSGA